MAFLPPPVFPIPRKRPSARPILSSLGGSKLPRAAYTTLTLDDTPLCRVITGVSHVPGPRHGRPPTTSDVTQAIHAAVDAGFSTFHLADASGHAQHYVREYARSVGRAASQRVQCCTKLAIDPRELNGAVTKATVEAYVDRALHGMQQERIHLLQLQWGDFSDLRFIDFLGYLGEMKRLGKVRSVGTASFPTRQLKYVASQGIRIASNQVSFSLLDRRPVVEMADWCRANDVGLLADSALGGGFFAEKYLGLPEPTRRAYATPSLQKFSLFIKVWGGWSLFQELLYAIKVVADKHDVSMANVAVKWALQHPGLAAVIVGARLGMASETDHILNNVKAFEFSLDEEDLQMLDTIAVKGNDMYRMLGDCGEELQTHR